MCQDCIFNTIASILDVARNTIIKTGVSILQIEPVYLCDGISLTQTTTTTSHRTYIWPANSVRENALFTKILRVLSIIHDNIANNKVCTVRDLYYQDVAFFNDQRVVANIIEKVQVLLNVSRRMLNIIPSPNGLIAGNLRIIFEDGRIAEITQEDGATLIPVGAEIKYITVRKHPEFILVVEKEAVFTHLYSELPNAIVITGKGFPDHYTRDFLGALHDSNPDVPIFVLVDSDVHGLLIYQNYEAGSSRSAHLSKKIKAYWIGVSILEYESASYVNMTRREAALSMSTLRKPFMGEPMYKDLRLELQRGLILGKKAEMNVKDTEYPGRLAEYVRNKVAEWHRRDIASSQMYPCSQLCSSSQAQFHALNQLESQDPLRCTPALMSSQMFSDLYSSSSSQPFKGTQVLSSSQWLA